MKTSRWEILENAALPPAQAHAILKVMESEMASLQDTLATKIDLLATTVQLDAGLSAVRGELRVGLATLRTEMMALRAETHANEGKLSRWVLTCILGQTAAMAGVGYFLLAHGRR